MSGRLLTAEDVAELLGVPKSWVYEQSRLGRIPTVALGRYRRYRREAIEQWVRAGNRPRPGGVSGGQSAGVLPSAVCCVLRTSMAGHRWSGPRPAPEVKSDARPA